LRLDADVICLDEALAADIVVKDGLEALGLWTECEAANALSRYPGMICRVDLLGRAAVRMLKLPDERQAQIQQVGLALYPNARSLPTNIEPACVGTLACLEDQLQGVKNGNRLLAMNPGIGTLITKISALPHMQTSINIDELQDSERKGFLREAENLKHIPTGRAELLAVFRHVPIEVISRMCFLEEKRIILYCISGEPRRTRTRVHDMAAVRDTASREIHLVLHRTRFWPVSLN